MAEDKALVNSKEELKGFLEQLDYLYPDLSFVRDLAYIVDEHFEHNDEADMAMTKDLAQAIMGIYNDMKVEDKQRYFGNDTSIYDILKIYQPIEIINKYKHWKESDRYHMEIGYEVEVKALATPTVSSYRCWIIRCDEDESPDAYITCIDEKHNTYLIKKSDAIKTGRYCKAINEMFKCLDMLSILKNATTNVVREEE